VLYLEGTPTEQLPEVLATGRSDIGYTFISMSARDPGGRDAAYLEWHSMDHRPEQYRLPELRASLRLVSTPQCRAARAANDAPFDAVDHIMTYQFSSDTCLPGFNALGAALHVAGRMPHRLPSVTYVTARIAGRKAAPRAVAGADILPWRPALGVYLIIERGTASPEALVELPGVAGIWWHEGLKADAPYGTDYGGHQVTYCYLDEDPVAAAGALGEAMKARWASGAVTGRLAAPFYSVVPFAWDRHLP
jgi:hypothetical protein